MAYYSTINVVSGDSKPQIDLTLRDANKAVSGSSLDPDDPSTWNPLDLTDRTVTVNFRALGSSNTLSILKTYELNSTLGECSVYWGSALADLPAGIYEGEIVVTDLAGTLTLFDRLKFKVRDRF